MQAVGAIFPDDFNGRGSEQPGRRSLEGDEVPQNVVASTPAPIKKADPPPFRRLLAPENAFEAQTLAIRPSLPEGIAEALAAYAARRGRPRIMSVTASDDSEPESLLMPVI